MIVAVPTSSSVGHTRGPMTSQAGWPYCTESRVCANGFLM